MRVDTRCKICGRILKPNEHRMINRSGAVIHAFDEDCWRVSPRASDREERIGTVQELPSRPAPHRVFPLENWLYW